MEQPNKGILVGNLGSVGIVRAMYELYKIIRRTRVEKVDFADVLSTTSVRASSVGINTKDCNVMLRGLQILRPYAHKLFCLPQAIGFFGATKVNLRNAP